MTHIHDRCTDCPPEVYVECNDPECDDPPEVSLCREHRVERERDKMRAQLDRVERDYEEAASWRDQWLCTVQRIQTALAPKLTNKWWTTDEMEMEVMRLRDEFRTMQRERDMVRRLLEDAGCSCDCEHAYGEHDNTCARCLGCRVAAAIAEDQS